MIPILDTHLHLLYQKKFSYAWCADFPALQNDFTIDDYEKISQNHGIAGSIFMEVDVDESEISQEAAFFTELAKSNKHTLLGVIAACRPEKENFNQLINSTLTDSVCGFRRVLHVMPDAMSQSTRFRENINSLSNHNLPFDLCINENQHEIGYDLIKSCPNTQFVLDHCGGPSLSEKNFSKWATSLKKIASLPNVVCKVSGIIAGLPADSAVSSLNPWIDTTIESFGTDRILIGSDWPVCNLSKDLPTWLTKVREHFANYSENEQHKILHQNAEAIYKVSISS
ncbi:MAG: amidohydrolase family protein [Akkermansiaceae bacterium]